MNTLDSYLEENETKVRYRMEINIISNMLWISSSTKKKFNFVQPRFTFKQYNV